MENLELFLTVAFWQWHTYMLTDAESNNSQLKSRYVSRIYGLQQQPCLHKTSLNNCINVQRWFLCCTDGGMFARCAPGACPARYLCIKYLIYSPKFILTLGSPPSRPH